ncbi:monooxygenase, FAD-binding [Hyphomonas neptunium ATCC 15444]|uniref:Monooxygenase, FAD-binding n=2 Tax=Hyphomonas TaxID=85 RepID=Q0C039_HYPNA|nr:MULTISPECIES: FAD-dependent oxidoreductase [Hyphomonas]ABI77934.1 monooxygenase, FAD-binding [Hyphomonas neptunium ATCC 15444]KCZ90513.1 hypothetical protein HHI_13280 [Hyphomonas hirschiana VP5]
MNTIETPVLIMGGGPAGLALAVDLGWRGVPCVLIEQEGPEARRNHPRMDNVGIRSMEFARRWGIVKQVEQAGFPRDLPLSIAYTTGILGPELARDIGPTLQEAPVPPFSPQKHELCPQNFFDPVMQEAAQSYRGNRLYYHHKLTAFQDEGHQVLATVEPTDGGTPLLVRAQYLMACDGAGSSVAAALGQSPVMDRLLSCSTNIFIRSPELTARTGGSRAYRYILVGVDGVWGSFVNIDGRDVWRLQLLGSDTWPAWSDDDIHAFVRRGLGGEVAYELLSWVPWARRERVADRFRVGRCFLVGDSAHQMSPTGGYGMNTGIAEAVDLSWKIAAVLDGWGGPALLDSYEAERRPVAARNVKQGSENLSAMRSAPSEPRLLEPGEVGNIARAKVGQWVRAAMQREWRSYGIHLGAIYRGSPITAAEEADCPEQDVAQFAQRACVGGRAPHIWLAEGQSTLDLFGRGFVLLDFSGHSAEPVAPLIKAAEIAGVPLAYQAITNDEAARLFETSYVLVRPDGHIAWRSDAPPENPGKLIDRVRGVASGATGDRPVHLETAKTTTT